ncbi:DUF2098 domain-containing protein [Methanohalophilus mahii]|uniref:DUF2098 domain-containing protein n=1 Tax=Methanohalophilus mahii (strain ATCC 35705 / DSM 5219 / SLP) TaxID=547558 RepID=D5EC33_METMS|nr:DUF2098 domain-containing protein [Methanohalophilus mahii]ADE36734.1 Protein of unknown function DUF2098 [Methanohalophilus mahii DSM 5219]
MEPIETSDIDGHPLEIGMVVRYLNTGTLGEIIDIKEDDEGTWGLLDTTDLYYRVDTLKVSGEKVGKRGEKEYSASDVKDYLLSQDEETSSGNLENVYQSTGGG